MQDVLEIQVAPLSPASGARISGVDLTRSARCRDRAGNPGRLEQAHCVKPHAIAPVPEIVPQRHIVSRATVLFSVSLTDGGVQLGAVLGGECHVCEHVVFAVVHQRGELGPSRPQLVGDIAQALLLPNWIAGPAGLVGFGTLFFFRLDREERMMIETFGGRVPAYMARTKRVIHGIF